jgi:hypothetical protein
MTEQQYLANGGSHVPDIERALEEEDELNTRVTEFCDAVEEMKKHPDGERRLRFIMEVMTSRPIPKMTEEEVWARYAEFGKICGILQDGGSRPCLNTL